MKSDHRQSSLASCVVWQRIENKIHIFRTLISLDRYPSYFNCGHVDEQTQADLTDLQCFQYTKQED